MVGNRVVDVIADQAAQPESATDLIMESANGRFCPFRHHTSHSRQGGSVGHHPADDGRGCFCDAGGN